MDRSLFSRLARGATWSIAGSVVSRGGALLASIAVGRLLGTTRFGEWAVVTGTVWMFQAFASFGLGVTSTRYVAALRTTEKQRAGRVMALASLLAAATGGLFALAMAASAPVLAARTLAAPHLAPALRVAAPQLLLGAMNAAQLGALAGFEAYRTSARVNFIAGVATVPLIVAGTILHGLEGAIWGNTASLALSWAMTHVALRREASHWRVPVTLTGCMTELPLLWRFSLPATLAGAMVTPAVWAASALLANQPGGYVELGIYNAVGRVKQIPEALLAICLSPLLPALSESFARKERQRMGHALRLAFLASFAISVPAAVIMAAAPDLVLMPFGHEYMGHPRVTQILALQLSIFGVMYPTAALFASADRMWLVFAQNVGWGAILLATSWVLIPALGGSGLAISLLAAHAVIAPAVLLALKREQVDGLRFAVLLALAATVAIAAAAGCSAALGGWASASCGTALAFALMTLAALAALPREMRVRFLARWSLLRTEQASGEVSGTSRRPRR